STESFNFSQWEPVELTENGVVGTTTLSFSTAMLLPGNYNYALRFEIDALFNGIWQLFDSFTHAVQLLVVAGEQSFIAPSVINFSHIQNSPLPSANFTVNGNSWRVFCGPKYILSSTTPGIVV